MPYLTSFQSVMAIKDTPLPGQFVLAHSPPEAPQGWDRRSLGPWHLAHSPDLPVNPTPPDEPDGFLLGWPLGDDTDLGGRWVHLDSTSVRLDPLGSYSVVYHEAGIVASSTAAMPRDALEENTDLTTVLNLPDEDNWFPFGLTPYHKVHRLLPDHLLHLPSLTVERQHQFGQLDTDDEASANIVAGNLCEQFDKLASCTPITLGLTAGNETRMLLAALRYHTEGVSFFTIGKSTSQDVRTARRLARRFDLRHKNFQPVRDESEEAAWFERVGRCVAGATMRNAALKRLLGQDAVLVKGLGGEVGRGYYYATADETDIEFDIEELLHRMHLPIVSPLAEAGQRWLEDLTVTDAHSVLDHAYIENRVGCWAAPQIHGDIGPATTIWPLNQVSSVNAMLSLSYESKTSNSLSPMVVDRLWPEILSVPINRRRRDGSITARLYNVSQCAVEAVRSWAR